MELEKIMTTELITINYDESLEKAEKLMRKSHIRHLPVLKNDELVGILSLTDLQRISFATVIEESNFIPKDAFYELFKIEHVMTQKPKCVWIEDGVRGALKILAEHEFHALPVMDDDKLVGIVTSTDLLKYFYENLNDQI